MSDSPPSALLAFLRRLLGQTKPPAQTHAPAAPTSALTPLPAPAPAPAPPRRTSAPIPARAIGAAGIALIRRFEGCARRRTDGLIEAYPDPGTGAAPWTIGWGATGRDGFNGGAIGPGTCWTQAQCDARLAEDLVRYAAEVAAAIGAAPTTQNQFDALVSFHYNTGAIARATLTRRHIAGQPQEAAREFARWNRAGGRVMAGLVRRRAAEIELYLAPQ